MPALGLGGDKEKFLVKFFSKNLRGVEQSSTALKGLQGAQVSPAGSVGAGRCPPGTSAPAFLSVSKKGGDECPPLGTTQKPLPQGLREGKGQV